jgi:simple sugar transport system permease protein
MKLPTKRTEFWLAIAIAVIGIVITAVNPKFISLQNLLDLFRSYAFLGVLSAGVFVVLVSGGIDISFTAIASVAQFVAVKILINSTGNIAYALIIASLVGIALGLFNALLIHFFKIPSIIATIATMNLYYGLLRDLTKGKWIYVIPEWYKSFASIKFFQLADAKGTLYGPSIILIFWVIAIILTSYILNKTMLGRGVFALGGNPQAAKRVGFPILRSQMFIYGYMGFLAGIGGIVHVLQVQTVMTNALVGKELSVIAAVVLGGTSLSGGSGSMTGTVLGLVLLAIISNGLTLMRVPSAFNDVIIGVILISSICVTAWQMMKKERTKMPINIPEERRGDA